MRRGFERLEGALNIHRGNNKDKEGAVGGASLESDLKTWIPMEGEAEEETGYKTPYNGHEAIDPSPNPEDALLQKEERMLNGEEEYGIDLRRLRQGRPMVQNINSVVSPTEDVSKLSDGAIDVPVVQSVQGSIDSLGHRRQAMNEKGAHFGEASRGDKRWGRRGRSDKSKNHRRKSGY